MKTKHCLLCLLLFLIVACTNKPDSTATQDSVRVESSEPVAENGTSEKKSEEQTQLDYFFLDYKKIEPSLDKVVYNMANEYDGSTTTYYYQGKRLAYVHYNLGAEGGYEENLVIKVDPDFPVVLKTINDGMDTTLKNYFSYIKNGEEIGFYVTDNYDGTYLVKDRTDIQPFVYEEELTGHLNTIRGNKYQFTLSDESGMFTFYTERKKVNSDYGEVEVSKSYQVSKKLFEDLFKDN